MGQYIVESLTSNDLLLLAPAITCQPIEFVLSAQGLGSSQNTPGNKINNNNTNVQYKEFERKFVREVTLHRQVS